MIVYIAPENDRCVLDFHHLRLWTTMPVLMWMEKPMFLRGIHHDNDSDISKFGRRSEWFPVNMKRINRLVRRNLGIDPWQIQEKWAALYTRLQSKEDA